MLRAVPSLLLTSLLLLTSFLTPVSTSCPSQAATEDLKSVIKGRCIDYKSVNPSAVCQLTEPLNCTKVSEIFLNAFAGRPTCNVPQSNYDVYLTSTRHPIPVDKSIFWHQVYGFVHRYSQKGTRMATLEDTLTGFLINGLRFCSAPGEEGGVGGTETAFCPTYSQTDNCAWNAEASFWSAASKNFATEARGVITIMLNASSDEAFSESSYLGTWEIPNLNASDVTRADIWMVHAPGDDIKQTCGSASVRRLDSMLEAKGIPATCTENPLDVLWLLCWDRRQHPQCQALTTSGGSTSSSSSEGSLVLMSTLFIVLLNVLG